MGKAREQRRRRERKAIRRAKREMFLTTHTCDAPVVLTVADVIEFDPNRIPIEQAVNNN